MSIKQYRAAMAYLWGAMPPYCGTRCPPTASFHRRMRRHMRYKVPRAVQASRFMEHIEDRVWRRFMPVRITQIRS